MVAELNIDLLLLSNSGGSGGDLSHQNNAKTDVVLAYTQEVQRQVLGVVENMDTAV